MKIITQAPAGSLKWVQVSAKQHELRSQDDQNNTWASGGTLEGYGFICKATTNLWMTRLEFTSEDDESLVRFNYGVFRKQADVELSETARREPYTHLLVTFGWYLAIMLSNDAVAAAT